MLALGLLGAAGCLHEASETCGDGGVCPPGLHCADTGAAQLCIVGLCGNGKLDPGEFCDDGNNRSGDGCPADCSNPCGDGVLDPGEACDDGNHIDGDGCSADCKSLDGIFLVTPSSASFSATEGDPLPQAITVTVSLEFEGDSVMVGYLPGVQQPSWLSISNERSGENTAELQLEVTDTSVVGTRETTVRIVVSHLKSSGLEMVDLPISYTIAQSDLAVQASPAVLAFIASAGAAPPPSQTASVTFNGQSVELISAPPWITVTAPDSSAQSPASFGVAINNTSFVAGTTMSGDIIFGTTNNRGILLRTAAVHVSYTVSKISVQYVAPYLGVAGVGGTVRLRGSGFPIATPIEIGFGDVVVGPVTADSDTQITVSYPPLPAGRYPVLFDPPGSPSSPAELVIVAPPPFVYQAIDAPSGRTRILYDGERQLIYGVNQSDQELERYVYANGIWSAQAPQVVLQLTDAAMAPDGRSLIVVTADDINQISPSDNQLKLLLHFGPDPFCAGVFAQVVAADDGRFVLSTMSTDCSGAGQSYLYDLRDNSIQSSFDLSLFVDHLGASGDGSQIYGGDNEVEPAPPLAIFDPQTSTISSSDVSGSLFTITVSSNASRVILNGTSVYSRDLRLTGNLPFGGTVLASRDSSRAFVYVEDSAGAHLDIYDLNGALQTGAQYPLLKTVMLPDSANSTNEFGFAVMTSSLDDAVVFISGNSKLLVVPVN